MEAAAALLRNPLKSPVLKTQWPPPPCRSLYRRLGAKLVVGMPFKDLATADSVLMYAVPPTSDAAGRRALRRLQEVG